MFNIIHLTIFVVTVIVGFIGIVRIRQMIETDNIKKYSLEKIFGLAFVSFCWIIFGFYKNVNSVALHFEVMAFCFLLIAFLLKLNSSNSNEIFGKLIPGHGKKESKLVKKIKYRLLYAIVACILLFLFFIFFV